MKLTQITLYPIKSLGGISLQSAQLEPQGLRYDRRWMIIDAETKNFLTQRQHPEMALLQVQLQDEGLKIVHKKGAVSSLDIPYIPESGDTFEASVWSDSFSVQGVRPEASAWFSEFLKRKVELVYMPDVKERKVREKYAPEGSWLNLSDRSPFLLIGQASLDDLNARLESSVPMDRFRPNFVFEGGEAYAEDAWKEIQIGTARFTGAGPCGRWGRHQVSS